MQVAPRSFCSMQDQRADRGDQRRPGFEGAQSLISAAWSSRILAADTCIGRPWFDGDPAKHARTVPSCNHRRLLPGMNGARDRTGCFCRFRPCPPNRRGTEMNRTDVTEMIVAARSTRHQVERCGMMRSASVKEWVTRRMPRPDDLRQGAGQTTIGSIFELPGGSRCVAAGRIPTRGSLPPAYPLSIRSFIASTNSSVSMARPWA